MICAECGKEHDGSYGSGKFCSSKCRHIFCGKQSNKNGKLSGHAPTYKPGRKSSNDWKCPFCGQIFDTRALLIKHKKEDHADKVTHYEVVDGKRVLVGSAWNKGLSARTDDRIKSYSETLTSRYASGEITPHFSGRNHTDETKQKVRESTLKYLERTAGGIRYNPKACEFFDKLNAERGWRLVHALNGGEQRVGRYSLDAYDSTLNIVVEYDERKHHYHFGERSESDIKREQIIKDKLGCTFYRYDALLDTMYEV